MPIETDKPDFTPADLNPLWPLEDDEVGAGDDHLRLLKKALKYAWDNKLFPSPDSGGGGGDGAGYETGDIRYTGLDKDDASVQPPDFLFASGQAVSRTTYAELFAKLGTRFGNGDGTTTFNVPDANNGFIPADVGIFTPGSDTGIPNQVLADRVKGNRVTGTMLLYDHGSRSYYYRRAGESSWTHLPRPPGFTASTGSTCACLLGDDTVVQVYRNSSSDRNSRVTWKLGESNQWSSPVELIIKPNASSSEQKFAFGDMSATPDGSLEVYTGIGSANLWIRRVADGEEVYRTPTPAVSNTTNIRVDFTQDGTKILRTAAYYVDEYVFTSDPWNGSFVSIPRVDTNSLEAMCYANGDNIYVAVRGSIYWRDRTNNRWVQYQNTIAGTAMKGIAFSGITGQLTGAFGRSTDKIFHMSAGAASPRIMGYVKT